MEQLIDQNLKSDSPRKKIFIVGDQNQLVVSRVKELIGDEEVDIVAIDEFKSNLQSNVGNLALQPPLIEDVSYPSIYNPSNPKKSDSRGVLVKVRTEPKVQRNSLCTCGSGKKFKNCCIFK